MNVLKKEQFENLCQQASESRGLFGNSKFDGNFNYPSEFQKGLVKKHREAIMHEDIFYPLFGIFCGIAALALFFSPFQIWGDISSKGIHSFTDVLSLLVLFGIIYGFGFLALSIFYDIFISSKCRYVRKCLKNGIFTVQECIPIGYAEYGTKISSGNPFGGPRIFVVLKDDNEKIYVFQSNYVAFIQNFKKAENVFLIKVDNIGKKKETEAFAICY